MSREDRFSRGLGEGFGLIFKLLDKDFQVKIFNQADQNVQLAIGLGYGLSHNLFILDEKLQTEIFRKLWKMFSLHTV